MGGKASAARGASAAGVVDISRRLSAAVAPLRFADPVACVYNPLVYAWRTHRQYLERFGAGRKEVLFLGMNPGPWGMAQTGVPFGEVGHVRDWMGISGEVEKPAQEHPKRPVEGLRCKRSEVSGARLWGWAKERFGSAEHFAERFFVANYCPLAFMEEGGKNRTPDKLPAAEREPLLAACDRALRELVLEVQPEWVVGVGAYAEQQAERVVGDLQVKIGRILHPSPASPVANRGWAPAAEKQLAALGIDVPGS
jgi:single-strand selective monofunctional uracil DNA glycosylase